MSQDRLSSLLEILHTSINLEVFHDLFPNGDCGPDMITLPGGRLQMGADQLDEYPCHEVELPPFAISRYPITFLQYDSFIETLALERLRLKHWWPEGLPRPDRRPLPNMPSDQGWGREQRPVIHVNWFDAMRYVEWLSEQTGHHYRLPTEAEWEYAARADGHSLFVCGDRPLELTDHAWFRENAGGRTRPVGYKQPNAWGLHDMYGNVWEWTQSGYHPFYNGKEERYIQIDNSPEWQETPISVRGGCWLNRDTWLRTGLRYWYPAHFRSAYLGFRVVRC